MDLGTLLGWLVSGGGTAVVASWLLDKVKWLHDLAFESKRWASLGLTAALAMLAYAAQVKVGYVATPAGAQGWLEALCLVGTSSFALSQMIHARKQALAGDTPSGIQVG